MISEDNSFSFLYIINFSQLVRKYLFASIMETSKQSTEELNASDTEHQHSFLRRLATKTALYCGGAVLVGSYAVPAMFSFIGFTSTGVTMGSLAASWQATHSLSGFFGLIQSASATNALGAAITNVGIGVGLVGAYQAARGSNKNDTKVDKKLRIRSKL